MADRPPDDPTGRRQPPRQADLDPDRSPPRGDGSPGGPPRPTVPPPGSTVVHRYAPANSSRRTAAPDPSSEPDRSSRPASGPATIGAAVGASSPTSGGLASGPIRSRPGEPRRASERPTGGDPFGGDAAQRQARPIQQSARPTPRSVAPRVTPGVPTLPSVGARSTSGSGVARGAPDPLDPDAWADDLGDLAPPGTTAADWDEPDQVGPGPAPHPRRRSVARRDRSAFPALPNLRLPAAFVGGDVAADRIALGLLAANLVGALLMALVLATASGRLPAVFVQHLDAAGIADQWGPPRILWRIPLIAFAVTAMNAALAWFLAPIDRFAGRFALAAALVVQLLAWIALFDYL